MKNWKTTLIGLGFGAAGLVANGGVTKPDGSFDWKTLLFSTGMAALGMFAKDYNVTGGTVQAHEPAPAPIPSPHR